MNKNKWRCSWKKIILVVLITLVFCLFFSWDVLSYAWYSEPREYLQCFELPGNQLPELDDGEPDSGSSIYFHESSCPKVLSDVNLNARQSCSVESALRAHPDTDVFLLISSPVLRPLEETENILVQRLLTYQNFKLRHITVSKYLSNTPLSKVYNSGALNSSLWPIQHASDVLRYATLYKFGGVYLDLDVLVLKPLLHLKNFAGAESDTTIGSGILGFSYDKIGREVATDCAQELAGTYNGKLWGHNGPGVITRILEKRCKASTITKILKSFCGGFQVFPSDYFSAISFNEPELLFKEGNMVKVKKMINQSYTIHFWNKISSQYVLSNNLNIPYINYAQKYCPKIYEAVNGVF